MEVKLSKYLSNKIYKWWYSWIIFKDDSSIHMENNSKKIDDGVKEGWKTDTFSEVYACRFKYPKLFNHTFYNVKW